MESLRHSVGAVMVAALLIAGASVPTVARAADGDAMSAAMLDLENHWAEIRYEMKGAHQEKLAAGRALIGEANNVAAAYPDKAEPLVWQALALLVEAEIRRDLAALGLAKEARRLLERAEAIEAKALNGMIQTTLGMLYFEMPGWPLGYGDRRTAENYLKGALAIDPDDTDNNYFYGDYLLRTGRASMALPYLERAAQMTVRPTHVPADRGRQADIQESLGKARLEASRKAR